MSCFPLVRRSRSVPIYFLRPNVVIESTTFPIASSIQHGWPWNTRGPVATQQSQESFIDVYHILCGLLAPLVGAENEASVSRTS